MIRAVSILIGYAFGCLQTSYFYGKTKGIDIRKYGSGNAGTTNALRVLGGKAGAIVFAGDLGKMLLAVLLVRLLFGGQMPDARMLLTLYTAIGVVLGHDFPFYLNYKGGKGIAVTGGLLILLDLRLALVGAVVFFGIFLTTHLVSLASCLMITICYLTFILLGAGGRIEFGCMRPAEAYIILGCWTLLALWRHRSNLIRLVQGKEGKIYLKKDQNA